MQLVLLVMFNSCLGMFYLGQITDDIVIASFYVNLCALSLFSYVLWRIGNSLEIIVMKVTTPILGLHQLRSLPGILDL